MADLGVTVKKKRKSAGPSVQARLCVRGENVAQTLGKLTPGMDIFGFTKGQFCGANILDYVLSQTGPANVDAITWSASTGDLNILKLKSDYITRVRFLLDFSWPARKPGDAAEMRRLFGDDCVRLTKVHAKVFAVYNDKWNIAIRSSMNLTYNPRFESFDITDSAELVGCVCELMDEIWRLQSAGECWKNTPYDNQETYRQAFPAIEEDPLAALANLSADLESGEDLLAAMRCDW